ncbi:MAG: TIGR00730 family Rossman fold protein [Clostridia bacterium]|nr:TIGR00730 family Rossman fold protein [Clostridia bacterium]
MNICVYGAASNQIAPIFLEQTEQLGEALAGRGHTLVFGAGGNGVMGAVARGAAKAGGEIVGIVPNFFPDGVLSPACTDIRRTETMRERKQMMEDVSDAFIMAPGGVGTLDEFFEILTLRQLDRHQKPIAIFNVDGVFDGLLQALSRLHEEKFIGNTGITAFSAFSDVEELLTYLEENA